LCQDSGRVKAALPAPVPRPAQLGRVQLSEVTWQTLLFNKNYDGRASQVIGLTVKSIKTFGTNV
jgi:hypothetical protein